MKVGNMSVKSTFHCQTLSGFFNSFKAKERERDSLEGKSSGKDCQFGFKWKSLMEAKVKQTSLRV